MDIKHDDEERQERERERQCVYWVNKGRKPSRRQQRHGPFGNYLKAITARRKMCIWLCSLLLTSCPSSYRFSRFFIRSKWSQYFDQGLPRCQDFARGVCFCQQWTYSIFMTSLECFGCMSQRNYAGFFYSLLKENKRNFSHCFLASFTIMSALWSKYDDSCRHSHSSFYALYNAIISLYSFSMVFFCSLLTAIFSSIFAIFFPLSLRAALDDEMAHYQQKQRQRVDDEEK